MHAGCTVRSAAHRACTLEEAARIAEWDALYLPFDPPLPALLALPGEEGAGDDDPHADARAVMRAHAGAPAWRFQHLLYFHDRRGRLLGYAALAHYPGTEPVFLSWLCAPGAGGACLAALLAELPVRFPGAQRVELALHVGGGARADAAWAAQRALFICGAGFRPDPGRPAVPSARGEESAARLFFTRDLTLPPGRAAVRSR